MSKFDASLVDVEHFLDSLGIENVTRATQHEMRFSCPFPDHAGGDESPSAYMNIDTARFFCHACKERGTAVDFAAYVLSISPLEAIRLLRNAYNPGGINPDARDMVAELKKIMNASKSKIIQPQLDESLLANYEMDWGAAARLYEETGDTGFGPATYFFDRGFEWSWLVGWEFGWDDWTKRVVFAIRDEKGSLIGFKGRATDGRKPKYLVLGDPPDKDSYGFKRYFPSHVVFNAHNYQDGCPQGSPLVVCEGEFNAIHTVGKTRNPAVAINGSFFSAFHARIIKRIAPEDGVVLFFDDDEAGQKCTWGWENSRGEWQPGVVDLLSPHMPVRLVPGHESDAADMTAEEIQALIHSAQDYLSHRMQV